VLLRGVAVMPANFAREVPYADAKWQERAKSRHGGRAHLYSRAVDRRGHRRNTTEQAQEPEPSILMIGIVM